MIGRLVGRVVNEEATGGVVLDVGGVGYELNCPVGTITRARQQATPPPSTDDGRVTLHVHTNLRQEALELFGFCSREERTTFRQLITVPNVGPRLALSVLNVLPSDELARVIEAEDRARLSKVPGVGKKTAERLVLELRGKLSAAGRSTPTGDSSTPLGSPLRDRLALALTGLGYKSTEAERAAKALVGPDTEGDLQTLLRKALDYLAP